MARARNIKPSFFKNELLGQADPLVGILFISLWTLADKAGRLEDRPLRIKAETFPYRDNININGYLTELVSLGFIERYEADGKQVIQIINFAKHQTPHSTEKASELPAKPIETPVTQPLPLNNESPAVNGHINVLNPDSLLLIPDTKNTPKPSRTSALALPYPDFISKELWDDFLEVRKGLKAKNTLPAIKALITELTKLRDAGNDPAAVVTQSIRSSWKDVYPIKTKTEKADLGWRNDDAQIVAKAIKMGIPTTGKSRYEILSRIDSQASASP